MEALIRESKREQKLQSLSPKTKLITPVHSTRNRLRSIGSHHVLKYANNTSQRLPRRSHTLENEKVASGQIMKARVKTDYSSEYAETKQKSSTINIPRIMSLSMYRQTYFEGVVLGYGTETVFICRL
jgi:hypothetical protein